MFYYIKMINEMMSLCKRDLLCLFTFFLQLIKFSQYIGLLCCCIINVYYSHFILFILIINNQTNINIYIYIKLYWILRKKTIIKRKQRNTNKIWFFFKLNSIILKYVSFSCYFWISFCCLVKFIVYNVVFSLFIWLFYFGLV